MSPINAVYDEVSQDATFFIDNSGVEVFDTCARAADYKLNRRRESNKDKPALTFGKIVHKLLEHRYRNLHKTVAELTNDLVQLGGQEFSKVTMPDGDYRNFATLVDVVNEYALKYNFEPFNLFRPDAVEIPFACPFGSIPMNVMMLIHTPEGPKAVYVRNIHVVIKGKIDLVISREGRVYLMDHKTTSMMGPTYFADFQISSQVYTYVWAVEQLWGIKVDGFIVNALGVRAPTKTGKKLEFARHNVLIYRQLVAEWHNDLQAKLANFFYMASVGYFPKQTKWCLGKFGACEYHGVCTLEPDQRDVALGTNEFKDVTWDPLKTED